MDKIIKLKSRYGSNNWLKRLNKTDGKDSKTYIVKTDSPTVRIGYTNDRKKFIDLSGGPFITEGSILEETGMKVISIDFIVGYGHVITFE